MNNRYIRFDWAAKNILRNKADYVVFEGFISVLVKDKVTIVELLESEGTDYLYHGQVKLIGVHDGDVLCLTEHERNDLRVIDPKNVFPEYYVIRVNEFDKLATDPLDEWIRYLKDEYISPDTTVPGLKEGRERLEYLRMTPEQQRKYFHDIDTQVRDTDVLRTQILEARIEGRKEGRKEGMEEGRAEGRAEGQALERIKNAQSLKANGIPLDLIVRSLNLSDDEIKQLQ